MNMTSTVNVDLDRLAEVVSSFFTVKIMFVPLHTSFHSSLEQHHYVQPTFKAWGVNFTSSRVEYVHKLLGFFFMEDLCLLSLSLFIYLLFQDGTMNIYFIFIVLIVLALLTESSLSWSLCLFEISSLLWVFFFLKALSNFLELQDIPGSSCLYRAPILKSDIFLKNPDSFYWRRIIGNQDLRTKLACCYGDVTAFSVDRTENICNFIYFIYTINIYLTMYI